MRNNVIGTAIKTARKAAGLTQAELAERVGLAAGTIQQYELGKREPRSAILNDLAKALSVPVAYFFGGQESPISKPQRFYFTYGSDEKFPFQYGWTEIEAPDLNSAIALFRSYHPDRHQNTVNCSFWYTEERFKETGMAEIKRPGNICHERITVTREVFG